SVAQQPAGGYGGPVGPGGDVRGVDPNQVENVPGPKGDVEVLGDVGSHRGIEPGEIVRLAHQRAVGALQDHLGPAAVFQTCGEGGFELGKGIVQGGLKAKAPQEITMAGRGSVDLGGFSQIGGPQ